MGDSKKPDSDTSSDTSPDVATNTGDNETVSLSYAELLENAKTFLQDESIKSAPVERQIKFLEEKGLKAADIAQLLKSHNTENVNQPELTTVHDSTEQSSERERSPPALQTRTETRQSESFTRTTGDTPPIITYPEFLLKPQKPPPIVTFQRLLYAGYGLAGLSALTYGASKYLIEPLLQSLTDARHDLASQALEDLQKLNNKLESSVSHIPYTASLAALKARHEHEDDIESIDSDPTELFHRDIATQTSPQTSRSVSFGETADKTSLEITEKQTSRLKSLHNMLETLVSSVDPTNDPFLPPTSTKKLHDSVSQFQGILDKLESTYNPFRSDYNYSSLSATGPSAGRGENNEAAKFKAEIRSLKGAFLSSRNFPAARPMAYAGTNSR